MRDLLTDLIAALDAHRPCVYCVIVETRGSTPQKPGASMLVFPDGSQRGTLGGGCEAAVISEQAGFSIGNRFLFDAANRLIAQSGSADVPQSLMENLPSLHKRPGPSVRQGVAFLPILPRITLLIVGGGHVGQAV